MCSQIQSRREISVYQNSTSSPPICKTGTWSCTGEQSALAVPHGPLMVLVGLQGAHTCSGRYSQYSYELLARAPGDCIAPGHSACLVHRCPGLTGMHDLPRQLQTLLCFCASE